MHERFYKVVGKVLNCGKGYTAEKMWERFQNSRKGYLMTISKLEMGRKGKGKGSFQSLPNQLITANNTG